MCLVKFSSRNIYNQAGDTEFMTVSSNKGDSWCSLQLFTKLSERKIQRYMQLNRSFSRPQWFLIISSLRHVVGIKKKKLFYFWTNECKRMLWKFFYLTLGKHAIGCGAGVLEFYNRTRKHFDRFPSVRSWVLSRQNMKNNSFFLYHSQVEDAIEQLRSQLTKMIAQHRLLRSRNTELEDKMNSIRDDLNENNRLKALSYSANATLFKKLRQEKRKSSILEKQLCEEQTKNRILREVRDFWSPHF